MIITELPLVILLQHCCDVITQRRCVWMWMGRDDRARWCGIGYQSSFSTWMMQSQPEDVSLTSHWGSHNWFIFLHLFRTKHIATSETPQHYIKRDVRQKHSIVDVCHPPSLHTFLYVYTLGSNSEQNDGARHGYSKCDANKWVQNQETCSGSCSGTEGGVTGCSALFNITVQSSLDLAETMVWSISDILFYVQWAPKVLGQWHFLLLFWICTPALWIWNDTMAVRLKCRPL